MKRQLRWLLPALIAVALFAVSTCIYYPADADALAALTSGDGVTVARTGYGWLFDGPSAADALIFYPGAGVEETAYAPFLQRLAAAGLDVCLVKMPLRLSILGMNRADRVMRAHPYARWYVGGHSMGGAMAAMYAARHGSQLAGVILCAAYPTGKLDDRLVEVSVYGSEDRVLNRSRLEARRAFAPKAYFEHEIPGGNHAQFGNYGSQRGDGTAAIPAARQQEKAVEAIIEYLNAIQL